MAKKEDVSICLYTRRLPTSLCTTRDALQRRLGVIHIRRHKTHTQLLVSPPVKNKYAAFVAIVLARVLSVE